MMQTIAIPRLIRIAIGLSALALWLGAPWIEPSTADAARPDGKSGAGALGLTTANLGEAAASLQLEGPKGIALTAPNVPACSSAPTYVPDRGELDRIDPPRLLALEGGPVGALARWDWFASGGAAMAEAPAPATVVALPLLLVDYVSQNTITILRNPNDEAVTVDVEVRAQGGALPVATWGYTLDAGVEITLDARRDPNHVGLRPNTPYGFLGSMVLRADRPIAAWTMVDIGSSDKAVYGYAGQPPEAAGNVLYAPLVRKQFFGFDTGIAVSNPNDVPVDVRVDYVGGAAGGASSCDGLRSTDGPVRIPAFGGHVFYQGAGGDSGLPERCVGSAVIRSEGGPVQAIVNDALNLTEISAAYRAVPAEEAATRLLLPMVRRQHVDSWKMTTGIQVMNPNEEPAEVALSLRLEGGPREPCGAGCSATVPPLGTHTFYPGANGLSYMPVGTWGEGLLESDRPILAIVNDWSEVGALDMSTYTALPCRAEGPSLVALP